MAAEGDYIMVNKKQPHCKKWHCHPNRIDEIVSGQGLHNSKSMYNVDLYNYMYDVSCMSSKNILIIISAGTCS